MIPFLPAFLIDRLLSRPRDPTDGVASFIQPRRPDLDPTAPLDEEFYNARVDLRSKAPRSKIIRRRDPKDVTAAVTHQAGVVRSPGTLARRAHLVTAHILVGPDGTWYQNFDLDAYLYHADLANRFSVGVEFSGNFEGHPGQGDWWSPERFGRSLPTDIQIHRGRQVLRWLQFELPLTGCFAHRQFRTGSKAPKVLDPGWQIYQGINVWAQENMGLQLRPDWTLGNGSKIPPSWFPGTPPAEG